MQQPQLTEADVIKVMRDHLEGLFPKVCPKCQRRYATLREYLQNTEHLGSAVPYDAELGDWNPTRPRGTVTYATCKCGNTLALSSAGLPLSHLWSLLSWARGEAKRRGLNPRDLLNHLREEICREVLVSQGLADGEGPAQS